MLKLNASKQFEKAKAKAKPVSEGSGGWDVDPDSLPVLVKPQDMFDDLCANFTEFGAFVKWLDRPLRVATMCSGTESPMLALAMMSKAVEAQTGVKLEIDHVFSCEIEPFKQVPVQLMTDTTTDALCSTMACCCAGILSHAALAL